MSSKQDVHFAIYFVGSLFVPTFHLGFLPPINVDSVLHICPSSRQHPGLLYDLLFNLHDCSPSRIWNSSLTTNRAAYLVFF